VRPSPRGSKLTTRVPTVSPCLRSGLVLGAKLARQGKWGWRNPSLTLHVEPLGVL